MAEASTDEERRFFLLVGDEGDLAKVTGIINGLDDAQKKHYLSMVNSQGMTALHYAVIYDGQEIVKLLLKHGADPELQISGEGNPNEGQNALELSVGRRRRGCTAILKEHMGVA